MVAATIPALIRGPADHPVLRGLCGGEGLLLNGVELSIENAFNLTMPDGQHYGVAPDGDDGLGLAPILGLRRRRVSDGAAFKDGRLLLQVDDGSRIEIPADDHYGAWNLSGPGGLMLVSIPVGDLAVWTPGKGKPTGSEG